MTVCTFTCTLCFQVKQNEHTISSCLNKNNRTTSNTGSTSALKPCNWSQQTEENIYLHRIKGSFSIWNAYHKYYSNFKLYTYLVHNESKTFIIHQDSKRQLQKKYIYTLLCCRTKYNKKAPRFHSLQYKLTAK